MERMILEVFAEWDALKSKMRDYTIGALDGEEADEYAKRGRYPDDFLLEEYKKIVREKWGVAFPQVFADIFNGIKKFRDKFAHMTEIISFGDPLNAAITIARCDGFERHLQTDEWYQPRYEVIVPHKELIDNFHIIRQAQGMLHQIHRLYCLFDSKQPPDEEVWNFRTIAPWWDGRWGSPPQSDDDWWAPVGRYRHHARERAHWDPDKQNWHRFR